MQTLLNLLAGVSLLVWGTHIVRTGLLRLYGGELARTRLREPVTPIEHRLRTAMRADHRGARTPTRAHFVATLDAAQRFESTSAATPPP